MSRNENKPKTWAAKQQEYFADVKLRILSITGIKEGDYATYVWELALIYLKEYTGNDQQAISALTNDKQFWVWWQNQWNIIDARFIGIHRIIKPLIEGNELNTWLDLHKPEGMNVYPGRNTLQRSYRETIGKTSALSTIKGK